MSERKVLNKYYPPDFDPSKIPRMKLPKNRQYTVRLMAPFNMRCKTCGEYIYKGKKFNARKEDVEGQDYLGIRIYRFYIKCTRCLQEISFKTDPMNTDYEIEAGATRNFMALKLAEEQAQREEDERKEDEATNPMKLLENRTKQSKQELELLESLEELRDLNRRQRSVDYDSMLAQFDTPEMRRKLEKQQEEEDEKFIKSIYGSGSNKKILSEEIIELDESGENSSDSHGADTSVPKRGIEFVKSVVTEDNSDEPPPVKQPRLSSNSVNTSLELNANLNPATDTKKVEVTNTTPTTDSKTTSKTFDSSWSQSVGGLSRKGLTGLVRLKQSSTSTTGVMSSNSTSNSKPENSENSVKSNKDSAPTVSGGLSLLGSYSGSDDSE